jgi:hypothetical protein
MARRTKRKSTKRKGPQFLVVRGKGNAVLIAVALPAIADAKLAKMIDLYRARPGAGVTKVSRAFIVEGGSELESFCGVNLGQVHQR